MNQFRKCSETVNSSYLPRLNLVFPLLLFTASNLQRLLLLTVFTFALWTLACVGAHLAARLRQSHLWRKQVDWAGPPPVSSPVITPGGGSAGSSDVEVKSWNLNHCFGWAVGAGSCMLCLWRTASCLQTVVSCSSCWCMHWCICEIRQMAVKWWRSVSACCVLQANGSKQSSAVWRERLRLPDRWKEAAVNLVQSV